MFDFYNPYEDPRRRPVVLPKPTPRIEAPLSMSGPTGTATIPSGGGIEDLRFTPAPGFTPAPDIPAIEQDGLQVSVPEGIESLTSNLQRPSIETESLSGGGVLERQGGGVRVGGELPLYGGAYKPQPDFPGAPTDVTPGASLGPLRSGERYLFSGAGTMGQALGDLQAQQILNAQSGQRMAAIEQAEAGRPDPMEEQIRARQKTMAYERMLPMDYDAEGNPVTPRGGGTITRGGRTLGIERGIGLPTVTEQGTRDTARSGVASRQAALNESHSAFQKALEGIEQNPVSQDKESLRKMATLRWLADLAGIDPSFKGALESYVKQYGGDEDDLLRKSLERPTR